MTVYTIDNPEDTGEIRRPVGENRTRLDIGEKTENLAEYVIHAPSFDAIPRRTIEIDDTVTFHSPMNLATGVDSLAGPQSPPKPLPPPPRPSVPPKTAEVSDGYLERLVDTQGRLLLGVAGVDGLLHPTPPHAPFPPLRPAVPPKTKYKARHRQKTTLASEWRRIPSEVRGFIKLAAAVVLIVAGLWQVMG